MASYLLWNTSEDIQKVLNTKIGWITNCPMEFLSLWNFFQNKQISFIYEGFKKIIWAKNLFGPLNMQWHIQIYPGHLHHH